MTSKTATLFAGIALVGVPVAVSAHDHAANATPLHVTAIGPQGQTAGTVVLEQTPRGVLISVALDGQSEGEHAFHIHEKGVCDAAGGFASAGGHFSPDKHAHGFKDAKGAHEGDMPNQFVGADGKLRAHVLNDEVTLDKAADDTLFDADGSALVVHAGADDYVSQPSGNAGSRVACAVIAPPRK